MIWLQITANIQLGINNNYVNYIQNLQNVCEHTRI